MKTFSVAAECMAIYIQFHEQCVKEKIQLQAKITSAAEIYEVTIEFRSYLPIETFQQVIRRVTDGNLMMKTLKECPVEQNDLIAQLPVTYRR